MTIHKYAGKPAIPEDIINISCLVRDYFAKTPDVQIKAQQVCFGTSGYRGNASRQSLNEHHIVLVHLQYLFKENLVRLVIPRGECFVASHLPQLSV